MKKIKFLAMVVLMLAVSLCFVGCMDSNGGSSTQDKNNLVDFPVAGGTYTGTATNGQPTGNGTISYDNGNVYEGAVVDGKAHGSGVMIDSISAGTYTGKFENGKYSDTEGTMEFDNGGLYEGGFAEGKMKGEGTFTWPDGTILNGEFEGTGGAEGACGAINANGTMTYTSGLWYEGTVVNGYPNEGTFFWPNRSPSFKGTFTNFLTGYGDLDMGNGIVYHGPMGLGLLVPIDAYDGEVTITYPDNGVYNGETFVGNYVHNDAENKDELKGKVTRKNNVVIENVTIALDFSFSYRYTGTFDNAGVVYTGEMRDSDCPYGAGVYAWGSEGPTFTATETHGWLTGYGVLDMKNGITYEGPLNAIAVSTEGGNEFQPYTKIDGTVVKDVKINHPAGVFTGELTKYDALKNASTAIKGFFGNAIYLSEGVFVDKNYSDVEVPFLFIPTFALGLYPIQTSTVEVPVTVAGLPYVGQYITVGTDLIAFGEGVSYWAGIDKAPRIECDFFYNNMTGVVKFVQVGYTYEGPMSLINFAPEMGVTAVTITFDNGDVFVGSWTNVEGVSKLLGTITYAAGGTAEGEVAITLTECVFTANA